MGAKLGGAPMNCPACDERISDSAWICPHCEHILDASFLGNDITNEVGWAEAPVALDPPTDGLDVDQQMIVESLDDDVLDAPTDDIALVREVPSLGLPKHPDDKIDTKPLPEEVLPTSGLKPLDPSLLQEIEAPIAAVEPAPMIIVEPKKRGLPPVRRSEGADDDSKKREALARAMARGAAMERRRSVVDEDKPAVTPTPPAWPEERRDVEVIIRSSKAEKIFQQALEDMESGNLVSARTNLKLALTFDPGNDRYQARLDEIEQDLGPSPSQDLEEIPRGTQFANQFYEKAIEQENQGNLDDAIHSLEKAIRADPQGVYYHRLGSILAFRQGKLKEGRTMVDKAIQRSPRNKNYQKTLSRILDKMNGSDDRKSVGMLGGLLKRK